MKTSSVLVFALLWAPCTLAYPDYWRQCSEHPTTGLAGHMDPEVDQDTIFELLDDDKPVSSWCPDVEYSVELTYPDKRHSVITASVGLFGDPDEEEPANASKTVYAADWKCKDKSLGRHTFADQKKSHEVVWQVACSSDQADAEEAVMKVTSSSSGSAAYMQVTQTFKRSSSCPPCA